MTEREQELEKQVGILQEQLSEENLLLAKGQDAYLELKGQHDQLLERVALLTARKFSPSSESTGQINLFDEAEVGIPTPAEIKEEQQQEKKTGVEKPRKHTTLSVPANTPVVTRFHPLAEENKDVNAAAPPWGLPAPRPSTVW